MEACGPDREQFSRLERVAAFLRRVAVYAGESLALEHDPAAGYAAKQVRLAQEAEIAGGISEIEATLAEVANPDQPDK